MTTFGILSDTHLQSPDQHFFQLCQKAFLHCDEIIHAGDLTDHSILLAFGKKNVHAVCGNMCNLDTQQSLPLKRVLTIKGYTIAVTHGAGPRHNIEDRVFEMFPEADCIIYGHTHIPVCHKYGHTLIINPGSFQGTGRYGSPGSYATLTIDDNGLHGQIHTVPTL